MKKQPSSGLLSRISIFLLSGIFLALILRLLFLHPAGLLLSEDKKFEKISDAVFRSEMAGSTLTLHYTLANPSNYQITQDTVSLGSFSPDVLRTSGLAMENYLQILKNMNPEKLSQKHQITYRIFLDYLETELDAASLLFYDEPLSPTLGIQSQLPILLAEYTFRTRKDIEDYLALLTHIPDFFSSILSFEREKAASGLFMNPEQAAEVASQCNDFISSPGQNYLYEIFCEKIDSFTNLSADEKICYKSRCLAAVKGYVIPAYRELARSILSYQGSSKNSLGLYYLPQGREYYRYLVRSNVGDDRSIEEIEEAVKTQMVSDYTEMQKLLNSSSGVPALSQCIQTDGNSVSSASAVTSSGRNSAENSLPIEYINELRQKITEDFPLLPDVSCSVKYVHSSLQEYLSPAFYLTPAIDDYQNNVIYVNPAGNYSGLDLYTTLAHEGYPGHLYQSVYFQSQNPDLLRSILGCAGYTEGWATYVEMYSYSLWDGDAREAALYQKNRSFTLGLASLLDIGIHYHGYTLENTVEFLEKLGFEKDTADSLYQTILQAPANYLQYYVGYLNFCSLRDRMEASLGEKFSLKEFHRQVLDFGPAPFYILEEYLHP